MRAPFLPRASTPPGEIRARRLTGVRLLALVFLTWVALVALINWLGSLL